MKIKNISALFLLAAVAVGAPAALLACGGDDNQVGGTDAGGGKDGSSTDGAMATDAPTSTGTDAGVDAPAPLPTGQIDRMGRPAINTVLNLNDNANKDKYNQAATFQDWTANHDFDQNFEKNLETVDVLAGDQQDWPWGADAGADGGVGVHPLRDPLKLDILIVDTNKECTQANNFCEGGYLELEAQFLLGGPAHQTCGGRTPAEDIIDKSLTLLITKGRATISDGVNAATKPPTHAFPYLADPN